jgi:protein SCO1/2
VIRRLLLAGFLAALVSGCQPERPAFPHALATTAPRPLPSTGLTGGDGKPFQLAAYHGKWVWLYFGYATCPDVCPATLGQLAEQYRQLRHADAVRVVFVSVDPARDRPAAVHRLAAFHHPAFVGAVGDRPALDALTAAVGAHYGVEASKVTHPDLVYVLDPDGRAVATYLPGEPIARDFNAMVVD